MGFPDRIERTMDLAHPREKVWTAITTAEGLGTWFGNKATVDLRPGGAVTMTWDDGPTRTLRVERVEEPAVFGFTWTVDGVPEDDPRRTYVEFTLEAVAAGTRLTVVESGFAQLTDEAYAFGFASHTEGWPRELGELVEYLDAV
jgi:uncharacterized protein YndB with AHSA1/START domain